MKSGSKEGSRERSVGTTTAQQPPTGNGSAPNKALLKFFNSLDIFAFRSVDDDVAIAIAYEKHFANSPTVHATVTVVESQSSFSFLHSSTASFLHTSSAAGNHEANVAKFIGNLLQESWLRARIFSWGRRRVKVAPKFSHWSSSSGSKDQLVKKAPTALTKSIYVI